MSTLCNLNVQEHWATKGDRTNTLDLPKETSLGYQFRT